MQVEECSDQNVDSFKVPLNTPARHLKGAISIIISCTGPFNQIYIHLYYIHGIKVQHHDGGTGCVSALKLLVNNKIPASCFLSYACAYPLFP